MLETYINEFIHLSIFSFLKITETEPRFFHSKKTGTGAEIKFLEPHSFNIHEIRDAGITSYFLS
jgi:hypothetical protein